MCRTKVGCLPSKSSRSSERKIGNKNNGSNGKLGICSLDNEEDLMISEQNDGMMNAEQSMS